MGERTTCEVCGVPVARMRAKRDPGIQWLAEIDPADPGCFWTHTPERCHAASRAPVPW